MVFSNNLLLGAVSAAASDYLIEQSLLFDGSSYLTRTPSVAGNRKTWTFSCWFKRDASTSAATQMLFAGGSVTGANDTNWVQVFINSDGTFGVGGGTTTWRVSSAKLADTSAWYHLTVNVDTTQATAADRIKMFLNGVQITSFGTNNAITLNADTGANSVAIHTIGRRDDASRYFNGLMALPILVDGAALDATSFGELDDDGYWNPIEFTGVTTLDYINPAITAFIGNMTGNGGLSAISDGSRTYTANTALSANGVTANAFAGVDWGVGVTKTPMRIVVQNGLTTTVGPSWDGNNSGTINMAIYGSNSAPASYNDGTLLGSKTGITNTNNANLQEVFEGGDLTTTTGYRYHWVHLYASATEQVIGEVQFFAESATPGYGTNGFVLDFADSSHFGNDVSGAGVTPDLTVATSWSGTNLAQYGFSAGNITKNTLSQNAIRTVGVWGGDFSITLDLLDGDGTFGTNEQFFGFASASDTFDDTKTAPTITGTNYYIQPATDSATLMTYYRNGAAVSTFAVVPGDTIKWERSGTTVTLYVNTVSRFSETTSLTGLVYGFIQLYKTNESADNVTTTGTFSNSFIDSGFATTDQLADTPTDDVDLGIGNFFNFDPNATNAAVTLAEGNTKATFTGGTDYRANITGVTLPTSGKWYFEVEVTTLVSEVQIGVNLVANYATSGGNIGDSTGEIAYRSDGRKRESGSTTTFGATLPNGSLVGVAWDGDANKIWFAKTNSWQASGNPSAGTNPANSGTISTASYFAVKSYNSSVVNLNTGAKGFTYTPPTDFVALATQNLPAPTIADGSEYFNTVLYTGNGSTQAGGSQALVFSLI
jgi:hypothetical protein